MGSSKNKFFVFLLIFAVYPKISYQTLTCGNNSFYIQYPFKLLQENQHPHHKSYHHHHQFNLKCNSQGVVVLDLPSSGEFYVRDIDYFDQKIELYDPGNCLPWRFKNFSLSSSPYVAMAYQNYTFFSCPPESLTISHNLTVVSCLSNSTASIVATSLLSMADEMRNLTGCKVIYSLQVPVSQLFQYEFNGFGGDLELAWNDPCCKGDSRGRSSSKSAGSIIIICFITISIATLTALLCVGCCLLSARIIVEIDEEDFRRSHSSNARIWRMARIRLPRPWPRPQPTAAGMAAASTIKFSTEVLIISGSQCISGPNSDSCPICLEEYKASERLSSIRICSHCFHADCLDKWLQREITCPICRTPVI